MCWCVPATSMTVQFLKLFLKFARKFTENHAQYLHPPSLTNRNFGETCPDQETPVNPQKMSNSTENSV